MSNNGFSLFEYDSAYRRAAERALLSSIRMFKKEETLDVFLQRAIQYWTDGEGADIEYIKKLSKGE